MTERTCRKCGCTQNRECPDGCSWVEADLCSACVPTDLFPKRGAPSTPPQRSYIRTLMQQIELDSSYMTMFHRRFFEAAQIECPDPNAHIEAVLCALTKTQASALATVLEAEVDDE
jgi:hypothetical protein